MYKNYDYLIVGAGLFGSTVARLLTDKGYKCLVIDKRKHIGGNCFSEKIVDIDVHKYGVHIFHTNNNDVWDFINKFTEIIPFKYQPIARYKNKYYSLPFNMWLFYQLWGVTTKNEAQKYINKTRVKLTNDNLEEYAISLVGKEIYNKFIKYYTQKQWLGIKAKDLPSSIIKRLPLRYNFDTNYFNDIFQGLPANGYDVFFNNLLKNIDVRLETDYLWHKNEFIKIPHIIYTGKIDELYIYKFGELKYLTLDFTHKIHNKSIQQHYVINHTSNDVDYTRTIEHKFFLSKYYNLPYSVFTTETPIKWNKNAIPYYPINTKDNKALYNKYLEYHTSLQSNIFIGGRLGDYKYYDMDKTILEAILLVKTLV